MNKRIIKWLSLFLSAGILTSCGLIQNNPDEIDTDEPTENIDNINEDNGSEEDPEETIDSEINQDLTAWMPRLENVHYHYEGTGNEYAAYSWYPQFNQDDFYQIARSNGGTTVAEIYEYRDDAIVRTLQKEETYYRDNFSEIGTIPADTNEETVLQLPIEVGNTWDGDGTTFEITAVNHEITVPADTYTTIEVTVSYENGATTKYYYAENVGLVAEIYEDDELVVESKLETIEENVTEVIPVSVYVADEQAMGMDVVKADIELMTNDPARTALQELLSGKNTDYPEINILPEGTEIQYLFLNNNHVVEVDVSKEFENMNAGSTGELFFIYNLVNTLSQYYGTDEVLLTVDGEPYSGAHMILQEGETLNFNQEMVNE